MWFDLIWFHNEQLKANHVKIGRVLSSGEKKNWTNKPKRKKKLALNSVCFRFRLEFSRDIIEKSDDFCWFLCDDLCGVHWIKCRYSTQPLSWLIEWPDSVRHNEQELHRFPSDILRCAVPSRAVPCRPELSWAMPSTSNQTNVNHFIYFCYYSI